MNVSLAERPLPRVLVVSARLDIGGTEQHLLRVLPRLRRRGLDISLFVLERGGKLEAAMTAAGVDVIGPARRLPRRLHALLAGVSLRYHLRNVRPDIVHFFLSEPYLIGSFAMSGIDGIRRVMSRRSLNAYQARYPLLARVERWLHGHTAVLLGNSSAVVAELRAECDEVEKIGLIHNGIEIAAAVDVGTRQRVRERLGLPADSFVLAVNANLIPYKGHRDLFAALDLIKGKLSMPWRLLLIGRDQGIESELRSLAKESGFADHVDWLGERSDAQSLLAAADIVVLPSHEEGFSNSLIEAMCCGLPVIATSVGGNVDAIAHEATGLLTPARDPQALAAALMRFYEDAGLRSRLGAAARARAVSNFSIDDCVARYVNLYRGWHSYDREPAQVLIDGKSQVAVSGSA